MNRPRSSGHSVRWTSTRPEIAGLCSMRTPYSVQRRRAAQVTAIASAEEDFLGLSYGCIVPHSPNLVPQVGRERSRDAARTIEAMAELGIIIGEERKAKNCVVVSPHSPFLPEAFGVWEGKKLSGGMERFQPPGVVVSVDMAEELADSIVDVSNRMEIPTGRLLEEWHLDRGVTVPAIY